MTEPTISAFVQRCKDSLEEYSRLRFLGVSHEFALKQSGFMAAVQGKPVDAIESARDVRRIMAGDTGE